MPKLKRRLGLVLATLYGLGNILGAGIYVLVGKVAGTAGKGTLLAFLIAMIVSALTAFSYMELASRYPMSASISIYLHKAFGKQWLSVAIGFAMIAGGITSAAALAQGFAGYLSNLINAPIMASSVIILLIVGLIAIKGIKESASTAAILTIIEITGLVLVIWVSRAALATVSLDSAVTLDPALGMAGVVGGAFLAFYAFIGFEDMVNVVEEVKNPRRTMPLAILFSLIIASMLYLLIALASINTVPIDQLASSPAPLTLVYTQNGGNVSQLLSLIGMLAAVNGIVVQVIMGSRILYGLSRQGWLKRELSDIHPTTKTPVTATIITVLLMITVTILLPLVSLASATSFLVLIIFALVNVSLLIIKQQSPAHKNHIAVPIIIPVFGLIAILGLISYQLSTWL